MQSSLQRRAVDISQRLNLTKQKWASICTGVLAIIAFKFIFNNVAVSILDTTELQKCPFCYGEQLCPELVNNSIQITSSLLDKIIFFINSKKPIRGSMNNQDVVIKKLASSSELSDLDQMICEKFYDHSNTTECFKKPLHYLTALKHIYESKNISDKLVYCNGDSFPAVLNTFTTNSDSRCPIHEILKFWTLIKLNPEPLILQTLKAEDGWPVPKYFGSCGRLAVVEHCGKELGEFMYAPLSVRMNLALQVLDLAANFTFAHKDYAFYFTDLSPMNLVVDQNYSVKLVDLEHVIISNKKSSPEGSPDGYKVWNTPHLSEHIECNDCLAFSTEKICEHRISDHNIYAVCKEIFGSSALMPRGLLHTPSECLKTTPPGLPFLLDNCIEPTGNLTRFQIADELKKLILMCQE